MSDVLETLTNLSYGLIPVGLLFVCGLLLWTAGRRVMRTGFAAAGVLLGGVLGWSFGEGANLDAPWIAAISGAIIIAVVATLAYRLAIAAAAGLLIATLAPMAVWTADERELLAFVDPPEAAPTPAAVEQPPLAIPGGAELALTPELEGWLEDIFGVGGTTEPASDEDGQDDVGQALRRPFEVMGEKFRAAWETAAPGMRGIFVAAAAFGAMIGFVIGALAPALSATLVSALGGSFLMLTTGCVLAAGLGFSGQAQITQSATFWTALWLVLAVLGLGIQSIFRPRSKNAPDA